MIFNSPLAYNITKLNEEFVNVVVYPSDEVSATLKFSVLLVVMLRTKWFSAFASLQPVALRWPTPLATQDAQQI